MSNLLLSKPSLGIEAIDLPAIEQNRGYIRPLEIPVITDDALYELASGDTQSAVTWDNLIDFGYGLEQTEWTLAHWYNRFGHVYRRGGGNPIEEPGAFVEAFLVSQREIPTVVEYAEILRDRGLLSPEEARQAQMVSVLEDLDFTDRFDAVEAMSEDDRWRYDLTRYKIEYLINLQPDSLPDDADARKLAETYALKRMAAAKDWRNPKPAEQANQLLLEALGLSAEEIKKFLNNPKGAQIDDPARYRAHGVDAKLSQLMAEGAGGPVLQPWQNPTNLMQKALSGNLNTLLAIRKFFGIGNMYELLIYQARVDHLYQRADSPHSVALAAFSNARAHGDQALAKAIAARSEQANEKAPDSVFQESIFSPEESARFETLSAFAVHEPALKGLVIFGTDEIRGRYIDWVKSQTA